MEKADLIQKNYAKNFFKAFILALILAFAPFKAVGFVIPVLFGIWFIIRSKSARSFKLLIIFLAIYGCILLFYKLHGNAIGLDFNVSNGLLSLLHYSSFWILLIIPGTVTSEKYGYEKYSEMLVVVLMIEGMWGIAQKVLAPLISGSNSGDVVEGTINPFSFIMGHSGFGNQFFAINMVVLLIFCLPYVLENRKWTTAYIIGLVSVVLASVGHVFLSMLISILVVYFIFVGVKALIQPKTILLIFLLVFGPLLLVLQLDEQMIDGIQREFNLFFSGQTPKSKAVSVVMNKVAGQYPTVHIVGVGPGQYSSRSGLIASGDYGKLSEFFVEIPFLELEASELYTKYVKNEWVDILRRTSDPNESYTTSTMFRPFLSMLAFYTEYGGLAFLCVLIFVVRKLFILKGLYHWYRTTDKRLQRISFCYATTILFLFTLGAYENYYETPQGIFVGILLVQIMHSSLKNLPETNDTPQEREANPYYT